MTYFNYDEIAAALRRLSLAYPSMTELLILPNSSVEGREISALRIGRARNSSPKTAIMIAGLHAEEWVPPDALVCFCADLLEAATLGTGLRYGEMYFDRGAIGRIVDRVHLVILPCANPDGRVYSQNVDPSWRKNRSRNTLQNGEVCYGVDLNRNFDIVWDFEEYFAPGFAHASKDPRAYIYIGPSPASEPETRNVVWLLDQLPSARWFIDIHSYTPAVLHSWGIDENQSADPAQNFQNPEYDLSRGIPWDTKYREFINEADLAEIVRLSSLMSECVQHAGGTIYPVRGAYSFYGTSGASDDYAYSRHRLNPETPRVLSFTIECGRHFQPDLADRENVIREVSAMLIAFAVDIAGERA